MRILLAHRNFPGQFRYLAPALARAGHKVGVLTWEGNQNPRVLPTATYAHQMAKPKTLAGFYSDHVELGAACARTAQALKQNGTTPDVVFGSINWGETLFLKEVWPQARHLGYAEFLYDTRGRDTGSDPEFSRNSLDSDMHHCPHRPSCAGGGARRCAGVADPMAGLDLSGRNAVQDFHHP